VDNFVDVVPLIRRDETVLVSIKHLEQIMEAHAFLVGLFFDLLNELIERFARNFR
jgi:hypothetical protein